MVQLPSQSRLTDLLNYDLKTGIFVWRYRADRSAAWNSRYSGKRAGLTRRDKHTKITIDDQPYGAHRLAFVFVTGSCPPIVDHIDGDFSNNSWANLRAATPSQNGQNCKVSKNNTSGFAGVSRRPNGKWFAYIAVGGKRKGLGTYSCKTDAIAVRHNAEIEHFGEFRRR